MDCDTRIYEFRSFHVSSYDVHASVAIKMHIPLPPFHTLAITTIATIWQHNTFHSSSLVCYLPGLPGHFLSFKARTPRPSFSKAFLPPRLLFLFSRSYSFHPPLDFCELINVSKPHAELDPRVLFFSDFLL